MERYVPTAHVISVGQELLIYRLKRFQLTDVSDDRASDNGRSTVLLWQVSMKRYPILSCIITVRDIDYKNVFFQIVTLVFWSFWIVDRELILPSRLDVVIPPWVNHSLHTTTSLLVLIEIYLCHHKYPTFRSALLGISLYFICYAFW